MVLKKKKEGGEEKDFDHMATKSSWKYAGGIFAHRNIKALHSEWTCPCVEHHFQSFEPIGSVVFVETKQKTSGWWKRKKKW